MSTLQDRQIARLQDRVDALEHEVQNLRSALFDPCVPFEALDLHPMGRAILAVLMARTSVTREQIAAAIEAYRPMDGERVENSEKCAVLRLRKRLKPHGIIIETLWGSGYRITSEMKAKVRGLAR